jgi:O-succinylbenzoate synthase
VATTVASRALLVARRSISEKRLSKVASVELTLWRDDVDLRRVVVAASQRHNARTRLYLRVEHDDVIGFGEVAPQPFALNGDPSVDDVIAELEAFTLPQVLAMFTDEGAVPSWIRVARFAGPRAASPVAVALVEMALLDRELRADGLDIATVWPRRFRTPSLATVSLLEPDGPWEVAGAARVRVKTAPGPVAAASLERLSQLDVPVLVDFNCSASEDDQVLDQLEQLLGVAAVVAVEQPYAPGNVIDHARLAAQLSVPLSLDEGVRSVRDLEQIVRYEAASFVCVKPARAGGLANARTMVARAMELDLQPYLGGFFESAYARRVHRLLAENCVREPSDVAPVETVDGGESELSHLDDGFGFVPSPALLARATVITTRP